MRELLAFGENIIDGVLTFFPAARCMARAERRNVRRLFLGRGLAPQREADKAAGLSRQVGERLLQRVEPPIHAAGIDGGIDGRRRAPC